MKKRIKIIERKLGRESADGLQLGREIELDPRMAPKRRLEVTIHETLHVTNPEFSENEVVRVSREVMRVLWQENYRKVLN